MRVGEVGEGEVGVHVVVVGHRCLGCSARDRIAALDSEIYDERERERETIRGLLTVVVADKLASLLCYLFIYQGVYLYHLGIFAFRTLNILLIVT